MPGSEWTPPGKAFESGFREECYVRTQDRHLNIGQARRPTPLEGIERGRQEPKARDYSHSTMNCPICKKAVELTDAEFPFCCERCRLIDLGNWASERYVISEPVEPEPSDDEED